MSRAESINAYRLEGESLAQARERLRTVVDHADDLAFAARLRKTEDGPVILARAVEVFGSRAAVRAWWTRPAIGLGNYSAQELIASEEGRKRLIDFLERLAAGGYS
ncbi:antitoxin Xre/MbcA/ParS toxin-binding domain-containing protein [Scleromatobacter humisilvae]|uniref:antitoxin Xre/MbcA/ParS toxin-binding domain-containing protein n=1 Tax=Scleromatobacter humisilvae TaxID=2897159 RepID=UPI003B84723C